jgi:hypothetical protein
MPPSVAAIFAVIATGAFAEYLLGTRGLDRSATTRVKLTLATARRKPPERESEPAIGT